MFKLTDEQLTKIEEKASRLSYVLEDASDLITDLVALVNEIRTEHPA
jgi:hypothetical protein